MTITESTKIILNSPDNWKVWLQLKRHACVAKEIWPYLDPSISDENIMVIPTPIAPTPNTVKGGRKKRVMGNPTTSPDGGGPIEVVTHPERDHIVEDLSGIEREELRFLRDQYTRKESEVKAMTRAMGELVENIYATLDTEFITLLEDTTSARQMLVILKNYFAPSDLAAEDSLLDDWHQLANKPTTEVEIWLNKWDMLYKQGVKLVLSDFTGMRAQRHFVDAIGKHVNSGWKDRREDDFQDELYFISFEQLLKNFRNWYRNTAKDRKPARRHAAYAVHENPDDIDKPSTPTLQNKDRWGNDHQKECLCGDLRHSWSNCFYINPGKAPANFRPKPDTQKSVEDKIKASIKVKKVVDKIRAQQSQMNSENMTTSSMGTNTLLATMPTKS